MLARESAATARAPTVTLAFMRLKLDGLAVRLGNVGCYMRYADLVNLSNRTVMFQIEQGRCADALNKINLF